MPAPAQELQRLSRARGLRSLCAREGCEALGLLRQERRTPAGTGAGNEAIEAVEHFLHDLCETRVLDPACGSGNFLYVTMEHMKRIEGEVRDVLAQLDPQRLPRADGCTRPSFVNTPVT